jgi:flagella basal body P-ring formation protein FlgA
MKRGYLKAIIPILLVPIIGTHPGAATLDDAIIDKMMSMYALDSNSYRLEVLSNPLKTAEAESQNVLLRPLSPKEPLGLFSVMVQLFDNGTEIESGQVRLKIKRFADVVVTLDKIRRHEELAADQVTLRRSEVTNLREQPFYLVDQLSGLRARRNLSRGSILTSGDVEPVPDIDVGREVTIVYSDGLCRITARGTAMQAGTAGDYIKVKNKAGGKIILVRVIDEGAVALDP